MVFLIEEAVEMTNCLPLVIDIRDQVEREPILVLPRTTFCFVLCFEFLSDVQRFDRS